MNASRLLHVGTAKFLPTYSEGKLTPFHVELYHLEVPMVPLNYQRSLAAQDEGYQSMRLHQYIYNIQLGEGLGRSDKTPCWDGSSPLQV